MKKKVIIIIFIILIIIIIADLLLFFNPFNEVPTVVLNENLTISKNEQVKVSDFIKKIEKGKIVSKDYYIDSSNYGKQKIVIKIENNYGKKREYQFFIEVK